MSHLDPIEFHVLSTISNAFFAWKKKAKPKNFAFKFELNETRSNFIVFSLIQKLGDSEMIKIFLPEYVHRPVDLRLSLVCSIRLVILFHGPNDLQL